MDKATRIQFGTEEVGAATREGQIELFFPTAVGVVRVHCSLRILVSLAGWVLWHWIWRCWFGLRLRWRDRQARRKLLESVVRAE